MSGGATDPGRSVQHQDLQVVKDATELTSQTLSTGEVDFSEETAVAMRDLGLSEEDALRHVQEQFERAQFREQLYAEHADCIGGFNYEIDSHRMTVSTVSDECRTDIVSASQEMPFDVDLIDANYSLAPCLCFTRSWSKAGLGEILACIERKSGLRCGGRSVSVRFER